MSIFKTHNTLTVKASHTALGHLDRISAGYTTELPKKTETTKSGMKVGR